MQLEVGKTYFGKDIAEFLGITAKALSSNKAQKEYELNKYCKYEKIGSRYYIIEIYKIQDNEQEQSNDEIILRENAVYTNKEIANFLGVTPRTLNINREKKEQELSIFCTFERLEYSRITKYLIKKVFKPHYEKNSVNKDIVRTEVKEMNYLCSFKDISNKRAKDICTKHEEVQEDTKYRAIINTGKQLYGTVNKPGPEGEYKRIWVKKVKKGYEPLNQIESDMVHKAFDDYFNKHCKFTSSDTIDLIADSEVLDEETLHNRIKDMFAEKKSYFPVILAEIEEKYGIIVRRVNKFTVYEQ